MKIRTLFVVGVLALWQTAAFAETSPQSVTRTPEQMDASFQAHKGDFDYLLGDWEFTAENKEYGKLRGYWSAVRLDEGQILDEYRVVGDKGDTYYVTSTLRNYNKFADRWELIGADAGNGLQDFGTGRRVGNEVHIEQTFGVAASSPSIWKIRYFNIQPNSFSWSADRSSDGGKTWVKHQQLEARRIGPARSLGALAPARNTTTTTPAAPVSISGTGPVDALAGRWKGYIGHSEDGDKESIDMMLKVDGKSVTGTITGPRYPANVTGATLDTSTGALVLDGIIQDEQKTTVQFEGTLVKGTASGTLTIGGQRAGVFKITKSQ